MKSIMLAMVLMVTSNAVMADWVLAIRGTDKLSDIYYDKKSIKYDQSTGIVDVWMLFDHKESHRIDFYKFWRSEVRLFRFQCMDRLVNVEKSIKYSGNMGGGKSVNIQYSSGWDRVVPNTLFEQFYSSSCGLN